jgi:hypothetical protein
MVGCHKYKLFTRQAETWCFKGKNGGKTEFHRNGLLATLGTNFQEGQN